MRHGLAWSVVANVYTRSMQVKCTSQHASCTNTGRNQPPCSIKHLQTPATELLGPSRRLGRTQTQRTNGHRGRRSRHCSTRPTHMSSRRVAPQRAMSPAEQQTCEGGTQWRKNFFRRFKRRLKRTGPRPDDEHGPRIRFASCTFGPLYASDRP